MPRDDARIARRARGEGRGGQRELRVRPGHGGNRQVAVLQRLRRLHVRPADPAPIHLHEGLDADAALGDLDGAVFANQTLLASAIEADDGPVRLLAAETAREPALRRIGRHRLDQVVGMRGERQRLHVQAGQGERGARTITHRQADVTRFGFGQRQVVASAVALHHRAHVAPAQAVIGQLHQIVRRVLARFPVEHQPAELAQPAQVQRQLRIGVAVQVRGPRGIGLAVHGQGCCTGGERGVRAGLASQRRAVIDRQRLERQLVEADRALAAGVVVDRVLELDAPAQHPVRIRPPGLVDVARLVAHRRPCGRKVVLRPVDPPHVVAAGVDELELQVVARRIAAQLEGELVVRGIFEHEVALDAGMARHAIEVVVQAQALPFDSRDRPQRAADLVGGHHPPRGGIIEPIQHAHRLRRLGNGADRRQQYQPGRQAGESRHHVVISVRHGRHARRAQPFTLPSSKPWM